MRYILAFQGSKNQQNKYIKQETHLGYKWKANIMLMQESKVLNFMYLNCLISKDRATLLKCSLAKMY